MRKWILLFLIPFILHAEIDTEAHRIRYLMQSGRTNDSLELYQKYTLDKEKHDLMLLQDIALQLLEQGYHDTDKETQLLAIYGAGIAMNDKAIQILEQGMDNKVPQLQLVAMHYLGRMQNDDADAIIHRKALASNFLLLRLEAINLLAQKSYPTSVGQLEALMYKVPPPLLPLFPELYANVGNHAAMRNLRRLMTHQIPEVRIQAVLSSAKHGRDDLLPEIRRLAKHHHVPQQEACCVALGILKDRHSEQLLRSHANSQNSSVKIAALTALHEIGITQSDQIAEMARQQNLFAIGLLGDVPGQEDLLYQLMQSRDLNVRLNATLALLERRDERCLHGMREILIRDQRDLAFVRQPSPGGGLTAWKAVPGARQKLQNLQVAYEVSLKMREAVLKKAMELNEFIFLKLANLIFETRQRELVPALVHQIESLGSTEAIELLKKHQQLIGAPLIRNYCNLALIRIKQDGPYLDNLKQWIQRQQNHEIIRFRPLVPRDHDNDLSMSYQLTPEETTRLLVESYETLAQSQNDEAINILLNAMQYGNERNQYVLAGLLMRAAQ